jgi:hypothetical protein
MSVPAVPFTLKRQETTYASSRWEQVDTVVRGLLRLDDDELVFQWREEDTVTQGGFGYSQEKSESEVMEKRVPLAALRSARLQRRLWLFTDLVLAAADLRAFAGVPGRRGSGTELAVRIARADRSAAADLASSIELALAHRLLDGPAHGALARG